MNEGISIDINKEALIVPDGIIVIGKEYQIIVFNEAASRITGFVEDDIIGKDFKILFSKSEDNSRLIIDSLKENRSFSNLSINITDSKNRIKNVLASITPILKDEEVLSVVLVFRNTKEMLTMAEEIEEKTLELIDQKNKLDAIFNSNIEGTFTIDNEWNVTSFNRSAEKITGFKKSEAIGKKCWEIFKSSICRNGCHMEQTMIKGKSTIGNELEIINKKGIKVPIKVNSGILLNNKNEKIGAVETFIDLTEIRNLSNHLKTQFKFSNIVGSSKEMEKVFTLLESVAETDSSVLITGESGTGKELVARAIHLNSSRSNAPFIALNCSAFAESLIESELFGHEKGAFTGAINLKVGRFEFANNGTLFLDEIGDISLSIQTKLLRVLETRQFERVGGNKTININVRIIAATNKDLPTEISKGNFREDLFYRINVMNIHLPPLRERMADFPFLLNHFIKKYNERFSKTVTNFSPETYNLLQDYPWPGNIRELENVIEHCFVLCKCDIIKTEHLPERIKHSSLFKVSKTNNLVQDAEKKMIMNALKKHKGNRTKASKELNINPSTLWRKIKKLEIDLEIE
ncbi:MAG TPA: sigma 54-interacting transcriptional regulator [Ignavibacteriaceae bacterium]|nr:sigma 54-interacting transcriptional regulator [Ignavibacteriaceae bacterium]